MNADTEGNKANSWKKKIDFILKDFFHIKSNLDILFTFVVIAR